ncbi:formyl transferase [bacterium]|nr:formyl transferase [bacterium]
MENDSAPTGITPIYAPQSGRPMRVAAFMSGTGTNLIKILEYQQLLAAREGEAPYAVTLIVTDRRASRADEIGKRYGIPAVINDIAEFYAARGKTDRKDLSLRPDFDRATLAAISDFPIDVVALAGYMSIVTAPLLTDFPGRMLNVHPGDLRVRDAGHRRYTGANAVARAIRAGERFLRSSVHLVRERVDYGELLMLSRPMRVDLPEGVTPLILAQPEKKELLREIADENQDMLKRVGDWVIYPKTLELVARGRFAFDRNGQLLFDGRPIPEGVALEQDADADRL